MSFVYDRCMHTCKANTCNANPFGCCTMNTDIYYDEMKLITKKIVFKWNRNNNATRRRRSHCATELTFLEVPTKSVSHWVLISSSRKKVLGKNHFSPNLVITSSHNKCLCKVNIIFIKLNYLNNNISIY